MTTIFGGKQVRKAIDTPVGVNLRLQKVHALNDDVARISVVIESAFHKYIDEANLEAAVEKAFTGARYLSKSLHRLSTTDRNLFGVFVARKTPTMAVEVASAEGLTAINDTVFQDANDAIWTVVKDGETSYLKMQVEDNINDLLGGLHIRSLATASHGMTLEEDYSGGNVIMYYDVNAAEKAFAIAIDGAHAYNPEKDAIVEVEAAQVMMVDDQNTLPLEISAAMRSNKKALIDYMKMLYGHHEAFFAELKSRINKYVEV